MAERRAVPGFAVYVGGTTLMNPELLKSEWSLPPPGGMALRAVDAA